jgi:hypothetical protein
MYPKLALMAKYQSTNNSTVTIFTDCPPSADSVIQKGLEASKACGLIIEERKIKRVEAAGDVGVNVVLEDWRGDPYGLSCPQAHHNAGS